MTQEEVIKEGYAKKIYEYALKNPNANIELLSQALLKSKRMPIRGEILDNDDDWNRIYALGDFKLDHYYYAFARDIKNANIHSFEKKLNKYNDEIIYRFARDVKGANIEYLQNKLSFSLPKYLYLFARDIDGANIEYLQDSLLYWIDDENVDFCKYAYRFARDINDADIIKMISYIQTFINNCYLENYVILSKNYIQSLVELIDQLYTIKNNRSSLQHKK